VTPYYKYQKIRTFQGLCHEDKDKDLKLVFKESLRTRTNIPATWWV